MLAGATAPLIRDAVGGRDGYRVMGVVMALIIVTGVVGSYVGTRSAPHLAVQAGAGTLTRPWEGGAPFGCGEVAADQALPSQYR